MILLVSLIWIFRPYSSSDKGAISKHLTELEEPFRSVETTHYLDGGSVGVRIVDERGREANFCLRADIGGGTQKYERLYYGALHYSEEPSFEISQSSDTILRLLEIMRDADGIERERDVSVASVSGRWRDFSRVLWRRFVSREY